MAQRIWIYALKVKKYGPLIPGPPRPTGLVFVFVEDVFHASAYTPPSAAVVPVFGIVETGVFVEDPALLLNLRSLHASVYTVSTSPAINALPSATAVWYHTSLSPGENRVETLVVGA